MKISLKLKCTKKVNKLSMNWKSAVPKRYKRNAILGDLHRAFTISDYHAEEIAYIKKKYRNAGFPVRFTDSIIREYNRGKDEILIPQWLFEQRKKIFFTLPYCERNESDVKKFVEALNDFTNNRFIFIVLWRTKKIQTLFPLKDRTDHISCIIYEGKCSCGLNYIGETARNASTRWLEHSKSTTNSMPARHLLTNTSHVFTWKVLSIAPKDTLKRKLLEAFFIKVYKPILNEQVLSKKLTLFHNGVT